MELTTPERTLFETEVYEIDDLRIKKGKPEITEKRILFRSDGNAKLVYISGIQMWKIKKENRWGFRSRNNISAARGDDVSAWDIV